MRIASIHTTYARAFWTWNNQCECSGRSNPQVLSTKRDIGCEIVILVSRKKTHSIAHSRTFKPLSLPFKNQYNNVARHK